MYGGLYSSPKLLSSIRPTITTKISEGSCFSFQVVSLVNNKKNVQCLNRPKKPKKCLVIHMFLYILYTKNQYQNLVCHLKYPGNIGKSLKPPQYLNIIKNVLEEKKVLNTRNNIIRINFNNKLSGKQKKYPSFI